MEVGSAQMHGQDSMAHEVGRKAAAGGLDFRQFRHNQSIGPGRPPGLTWASLLGHRLSVLDSENAQSIVSGHAFEGLRV